MNELVAELETVVTKITAAQESGKEHKRQAKTLIEALKVLDEFPLSETDLAVTCAIQDLADELEASGGGKTEATDKLANRVKGLIAAEIMDEDETVKAQELVDKYKGLGSSGGTRVNSGVTSPDFPFAIEVFYNGVKVTKQGMKNGVYWNSIRHECRKYETKVLGHGELSGNGDWLMAKAAFANGEVSAKAGLFDLVKV